MLGLCLVKVSARLVEVRPSYGPKTEKKTVKKRDFCHWFAQRSGSLLGPTLVDAAEILRGWWGMLGLCVVKVLARLVEIQSGYGLKTAEN